MDHTCNDIDTVVDNTYRHERNCLFLSLASLLLQIVIDNSNARN